MTTRPPPAERLTFARVGITDPLSITDYMAHGGFAGLKKALTMAPAECTDPIRNGLQA